MSKRNEFTSIYDTQRNCYYNQLYYGKALNSVNKRITIFNVILAVSSSTSVLSALTLLLGLVGDFDDFQKWVLALGTVVTFLINAYFKYGGIDRRKENYEILSGVYTSLLNLIEPVVNDVQSTKKVSNGSKSIHKTLQSIRTSFSQLESRNQDEKLSLECFHLTNKRFPKNNYYYPPKDT